MDVPGILARNEPAVAETVLRYPDAVKCAAVPVPVWYWLWKHRGPVRLPKPKTPRVSDMAGAACSCGRSGGPLASGESVRHHLVGGDMTIVAFGGTRFRCSNAFSCSWSKNSAWVLIILSPRAACVMSGVCLAAGGGGTPQDTQLEPG
eukprot:CAMPEP_0197900668 /NCGR_PEP_ID=MMETSP1439-20131203/49586_1 /TAXON_ID=66791 /ORGANISM="Gonyaulax spinifera, Strain CCMP409" /LENGTH=147 /DNA_ID=CAMNT_0043521575 /DNA_START=205 /DNA_END=645 /DNA_ORIENTATION=-